MEKFVLIDGNSLINRAYYGVMQRLTDSSGNPTNAIYGFVSILNKIIETEQPSHIAVAFDVRAKTFRHNMYDGYKADRKGMPDELAAQMPVLKDVLKAMNIKILEKSGIEADDIIGTLSKRFSIPTIIVTGDRDALQLVDDTTTLWLTKKGISEIVEVTPENIVEQFGVRAEQVVDYKAIMGDASDCIPGVKGIGEKGALTLIQKYSTLDNIYNHIDEITGATKQKLIDSKELAYLSKTLAKIVTDDDIDCTEDCCYFSMPLPNAAREKLSQLGFKTLLARMKFAEGSVGNGDEVKPEKQAVTVTEISDLSALKTLAKTLETASEFALFLDTDISIATTENTEYKIKIAHNFLDGGVGLDEAISTLKIALENDNLKVVFDSKALRHTLEAYNIQFGQICDDISIAAYIHECGKNFTSFKEVCLHFSTDFSCPAAALLTLKKLLLEGLKARNQLALYTDIELPLAYVLFDAEREGITVDNAVLNELSDKYHKKAEALTQSIYTLAGQEFNINSPRQLGEILFEKLNLPKGKKTKTGYSTGIEVLEALQGRHPIIDYIMEYRTVSKLLSTYLDGMRHFIAADNKIHTVYKQTLTNTGRLSSTDPNLQNIPIRQEEGREIRRMFVPSSPEHVLISADYSQIELRLLAHFSLDPALVDAYKTGKDIHTITASQVFNMPLEFVTPDMRRNAKAVNFGIIYGISDFGLAANIGTTPRQARDYIEKYFAAYPSVKGFMHGVVENARTAGYVGTLFGRRRKIDELFSSNHNVRSFGERAAMNMPLQGTAADIVKVAMVNIFNRFKKENIKSKVILQIHDEIVVDALKHEEEAVYKILKEEMTQAAKLNVPLEVEIKSGGSLFK